MNGLGTRLGESLHPWCGVLHGFDNARSPENTRTWSGPLSWLGVSCACFTQQHCDIAGASYLHLHFLQIAFAFGNRTQSVNSTTCPFITKWYTHYAQWIVHRWDAHTVSWLAQLGMQLLFCSNLPFSLGSVVSKPLLHFALPSQSHLMFSKLSPIQYDFECTLFLKEFYLFLL